MTKGKKLTKRQRVERGLPPEEELPKGSIVGGAVKNKIPWSPADLAKFKRVKILPEETISITWQGICFQIFEGVPCELPEPHANIYEEYTRQKHTRNIGVIHTSQGDVKILGYGSLERP